MQCMIKKIFIVCLFLSLTSIICNAQKRLAPIKAPAVTFRNKLPVLIIDCWQHLDIENDTIAGTSLNRAYREIIKNKKGKQVIVAVIDTDMNIHHEDLKPAIWINKKEIPNNGIDDDHNGYIDDVNGWNFMGNSKGDNIIYANAESVRVIRNLKNKYPSYPNFKGNKLDSLLHLKATERYKKDKEDLDRIKDNVTNNLVKYRRGLATLKTTFHKSKFTFSEYEELYFKNEKADSTLVETILFMRELCRLGKDDERVLKIDSTRIVDQYATTLNEAYYDRSITGDNENDIKDAYYGNNNVYKDAEFTYHGTIVTGVIGANRANKIGIEGFSDAIKIMPIHAVPIGGSECNKDVALAIRYAVDNGAKVINMSFGNTSLLNSAPLIDEAFIYAQQHDVLLVAGAGNDMKDNDITPFFPIDYDINTGKEFCNNFIKVASITTDGDQYFLAPYTNYGKQTVDLFAPGHFLKTTYALNKYAYRDGTSMATPIVCGVAAVIRSYYPKLTASQVKQIILDSGVAYDNLKVQVPGEKEGVLKPFSELSKSGKVVNVYNAMIMAAGISK
jgi:cell wall-associated protease